MAGTRSSASIPTLPPSSWPASAPTRSSARCAFPSSTIRRWRNARPPARRSLRSTAPSRLRALILRRGERGLVRRGHGDLHLGNIALIDGRPVPFDAVEFDPLIAAGDVLYDLAFLLMDLVERGLEPIANLVLNRYLTESRRIEDLDALAALPLFLSLRAAIRAKVTAAKLHMSGTDRAAT